MTKRRFRIEAGNRGGELTIGTVSKGFVDYFIKQDEEDLINFITDLEWEDNMLPEDALQDPESPPSPGEDFCAWHECDNLEHINGAYADSNWCVTEVPADGSDDYDFFTDSQQFEPYQLYGREAYHSDEQPEDSNTDCVPVLVFHSGEKGSFGCWFVETDGEDFDARKVAFTLVETNLAELVENVYYDKVLLEQSWDYADSTGKGYYAQVGYFNTKWHDQADRYTDEHLNENCYWDEYDDAQNDQ
jgi:hypothetical protein